MSSEQARLAATGRLREGGRPFALAIGTDVAHVETVTDADGEPIYHVARLEPSGYVFLSADDRLEPIIAALEADAYDPTDASPLTTLLTRDLSERLAAARASETADDMGIASASPAQVKWRRLIDSGAAAQPDLQIASISHGSDIRVDPFIESQWNQGSVCGEHVYNCYTPEHYVCGCVGTTMGQLMRYWRYPTAGIGRRSFTIEVEGVEQTRYTVGGDGSGGAYQWEWMVLDPDCGMTLTERQAIGAVCYDAAISVGTDFGPDGSGADALQIADALKGTFYFTNAIEAYRRGDEIGSPLDSMIGPNMDARCPVVLGIRGESGHAVIVDGYGYDAGTLYHHLNMGWGGYRDAWYNLPEVLDYTAVTVCIYNVFPETNGEIISGRVLDSAGEPISGVLVTAANSPPSRTPVPIESVSNERGIYALVGLPSSVATTITAVKDGFAFDTQTVYTGTSRNFTTRCGNRWQIDVAGARVGDYNDSRSVDPLDLAVFSTAWLTQPGQADWNPDCDLADPPDGIINAFDLATLAHYWRR